MIGTALLVTHSESSAMITHVFIDGEYVKEEAYFKTFRNYPIAPGASTLPGFVEYTKTGWVGTTFPVGKMNLLDLLKKVGNYQSPDIMIICHADKTGLHIPLVAGGKSSMSRLDLRQLFSTKATAASELGITSKQLAAIQESIKKLHAQKRNHLAVRACAIGASTDTLEMLMKIFGVRSGSAPKLRVFCGDFKVSKVKQTFQADANTFSRDASGYEIYNETPDRIGFTTAGGEIGNPSMQITSVLIESYGAVDVLMDSYFPAFKRIVKVTKTVGNKKLKIYEPQNYNYKPGDVVPLYWMWDQKRMIFVSEAKFSDNLLYRTNPYFGADVFKQ